MKKNGYRGKKRGGVTAEGAVVAAILTLLLILGLTTHATAQWTGMSAGEQIHQALFELTDY